MQRAHNSKGGLTLYKSHAVPSPLCP